MSDTPRTDEGYIAHYAEHEHNIELCRQLERELAAAQRQNDDRAAYIAGVERFARQLERELADAFQNDRQKTREINILVEENRALIRQNDDHAAYIAGIERELKAKTDELAHLQSAVALIGQSWRGT